MQTQVRIFDFVLPADQAQGELERATPAPNWFASATEFLQTVSHR
jgi:hypothetical protein